jgi:predicted nucleic acid-binding protein
MAKFILCDSGFWIALYDKKDQYHMIATKLFEKISLFYVLIPWPVLYEVLRTRFVRRRDWIQQFKRDLKKLQVEFIDDTPYRNFAFSEILSVSNKRNLSLVDRVIRKILEDKNKRIDCLITFNEKDFIDICQKRKIPIWNFQFYMEE